jgi:hypothetical protein
VEIADDRDRLDLDLVPSLGVAAGPPTSPTRTGTSAASTPSSEGLLVKGCSGMTSTGPTHRHDRICYRDHPRCGWVCAPERSADPAPDREPAEEPTTAPLAVVG